MKNFEDFKKSMPVEKINDIFNARLDKIAKAEKKVTFEDATEQLIWNQRHQMIGTIFDLLEEYHNWLNA